MSFTRTIPLAWNLSNSSPTHQVVCDQQIMTKKFDELLKTDGLFVCRERPQYGLAIAIKDIVGIVRDYANNNGKLEFVVNFNDHFDTTTKLRFDELFTEQDFEKIRLGLALETQGLDTVKDDFGVKCLFLDYGNLVNTEIQATLRRFISDDNKTLLQLVGDHVENHLECFDDEVWIDDFFPSIKDWPIVTTQMPKKQYAEPLGTENIGVLELTDQCMTIQARGDKTPHQVKIVARNGQLIVAEYNECEWEGQDHLSGTTILNILGLKQ